MTPPAPSAQHVLPVARRFADMDLLGHVNNVRFLDYVTAGREALLEARGVAPAAVTVRRHRIGFVAPMVFGRAPAEVRSGIVAVEGEQVRLAHEVVTRGHHGDEDPTTHLRTETVLHVADPAARDGLAAAAYVEAPGWREVAAADLPVRHVVDPGLRTRDLAPDGAARDDAVMEAFQEARVRYFMDLHTPGEDWGHVVVAHTDLDLHAPVRPAGAAGDRPEVRSWLAHLGTSSFTVRSDLVDAAGTPLARADVVLVCFDAASQRPAPMRPAQRRRLEAELRQGPRAAPGTGLAD